MKTEVFDAVPGKARTDGFCLPTGKKKGSKASEKLLIVQLPRTGRTC